MTGPAPSVARTPFTVGDWPLGRALDDALVLTQRHGWKAALIGVVPALPFDLAASLLQEYWVARGRFDAFSITAVDLPWRALFGALIGVPLEAGMVVYLALAYLNVPTTVREGYRHALRCWWRVAPLYLVLIPMFYIGFQFMCIVPGLLLATALVFHVPVIALEGSGPFTALGRGLRLLSGRWGTVLLVYVAYTTALFAMSGLADSTGNPYAGIVLTQVSVAIIQVYSAALAVVLYFAARSRHEAIDLQLRADAIADADGGDPIIRL